MNQVMAPKVALGIGDVEGMMGLVPGSLRGLPWMLIQEEAMGRSREAAGQFLGVGNDVVAALLVEVTQADQQSNDSEEQFAIANAIWAQGIAAIRGAQMIMNQVLETGWDQVEAMALNSLQSALQKPNALKDPKDALLIAEKANRALRRKGGESATLGLRSPDGAGMAGGAGLSLNVAFGTESSQGGGTHIGHMMLSLSPRIREQLQSVPKPVDSEDGTLKNMKMLSLADARKLADATTQSAPVIDMDKGSTGGFKFAGMNFNSVMDKMKESQDGNDTES